MRDADPVAEVCGIRVDLTDHDLLGVRQELRVGEVGADEQQQVRVMDARVGGAVAEQTRHADVVRVVVLDPLLAPERVADGSLEQFGERDDLVVCALDAGAGEDGDGLRRVDRIRERLHVGLGGHQRRRLGDDERGEGLGRVEPRDIPGDHDHRHAWPGDRVPQRRVHDVRRLLGRKDELAIVRTLHEQPLGVGLLEVARSDIRGRDVAGDREHGRLRAVRVEEAVDQVEVAGPATSRAHRESARELRLSGGHERGGFLVSHVDPVDAALRGPAGAPDGVDDRIQRVPDDAVDVIHPGIDELGDELICDGARHGLPPLNGCMSSLVPNMRGGRGVSPSGYDGPVVPARSGL